VVTLEGLRAIATELKGPWERVDSFPRVFFCARGIIPFQRCSPDGPGLPARSVYCTGNESCWSSVFAFLKFVFQVTADRFFDTFVLQIAGDPLEVASVSRRNFV
jgi:hypothetical protein